jgi:hypothetical protein
MPAMDPKAYLSLIQEKQSQIRRDMKFCDVSPDPVCRTLNKGLQAALENFEKYKSDLIDRVLTDEINERKLSE